MRAPVRIVTLTLSLAVLGTAVDAHAQIVNVQSVLSTEAKEGLSGSASATADWRTGNTRLLLLGLSPVARFRAGDNLVIAILRGDYGKSKDTTIAKKAFAHLRYRRTLHERVLAEVFVQGMYDEVRLLKLRALVGVGPKFDLVKQKGLLISLGIAYMLEHERPNDNALETENTTLHRASSYLTGSFELDDRVQVVETVYVQPRIDDPGDIRVLDESQLVTKLTKRIALTTSLVVGYDSSPLTKEDGTELDTLDTTMKTSITVEF